MIQVIMGLKGSGKTKKLLDSIHEAVANASGDVVCIEYGKKLTYDVNYRVRLVDSKEYGISNSDMLKGLLSGLHAGNFDITNVYIDNLYKTIGADRAAGEVSAVNDDKTDNYFAEPTARFADIEEDEPILYPLCNEYAILDK